MQYYAVISPEGELLRHGRCQESEISYQAGLGTPNAVVVLDPSEYRDDLDAFFFFGPNGLELKRPIVEGEIFSIAADGVEEISFDLPKNTSILFDGAIYAGEEKFVFSTNRTGEFTFDLFPPPTHLTKRIVINAV